MFLAWLLSAQAAELDPGWYLAYTGRPEAAAAVASTAIRYDPTNVDAHRLYAWSRSAGLREGPVLEAQYRAWLQDDGGEAAALTLAWLLSWRNRGPGPWCDEMRDLTTPLPQEPQNRYWAQRVQLESSPSCGGDVDGLMEDLLELGDSLPLARPFAVELAVSQGLIDSMLQEEIATTLASDPWALLSLTGLWRGAQGPRLEETQQAVIAVAESLAESDLPHEVWASIQVLGTIGDMERVGRTSQRLAELDPGAQMAPASSAGDVSWLSRPMSPALTQELGVVYEAASVSDPGLAIKQLKRIGTQLGVDGPGRQAWQLELFAAYAQLGKEKKAMRHLREAWAADPSNSDVANQFAYTAALRGEHLDAALLAIDYALSQPIRWDPRGDHLSQDYGSWLLANSAERGAWLDTRGWVLHRLGQDREAAVALERALLMAGGDGSITHLHLGIVYAELGKGSLALDHLGRGLATGRGEEPALTAAAKQIAEPLFAISHWSPGGLDGWIQTLRPAASIQEPEAPDPPVTGGPDEGTLFPNLPFFVQGEPTFLASLPGWRVVDVWATWCAPCLESVPHLEALAETWASRGVTIVALSVDEEPETLSRWLLENNPQGPIQGWIGTAGLSELGLDGIPAVFVVDPEGVVRATLRGWGGPGDLRLDQALEDLVGDAPVDAPVDWPTPEE
jgi:thiol-disulfide isomerase/thioredoxin/tetratricopeptide (TPR) repeat protein